MTILYGGKPEEKLDSIRLSIFYQKVSGIVKLITTHLEHLSNSSMERLNRFGSRGVGLGCKREHTFGHTVKHALIGHTTKLGFKTYYRLMQV